MRVDATARNVVAVRRLGDTARRLGDTARRLGDTARFVFRAYRIMHRVKTRQLSAGGAGRELAEESCRMGPLYMKMAQFVSARRDVLDAEFAEALAAVQDSATVDLPSAVPWLPGYEVVGSAPLASASIADVFLATRASDGARVAIKCRRPGVKDAVETDLPLLKAVMRAAAAAGVPAARNLYELIHESQDMVLMELDFRREAEAARQFADRFRDVPWLRVPRVLHAAEDVMVSEYVPSRRLTRVAVPNAPLARRVMDLYMLMLTNGLVHADPHPGNIGFLPAGRLVLYDFGAMLHIDPDVGGALKRVLQAGITKDADGVIDALEDLGVLRMRPGQKPGMRRVVRRLLASGAGVHAELQNVPEFTDSDGRRRVVTFEKTFIYLVRTLSLVEGTCRHLDPGFAYDYARWIPAPAPVEVAVSVARDLSALPSTLQSMQSDLEDFQARVTGELDDLYAATTRVGRAAGLVALVAAVAALLR